MSSIIRYAAVNTKIRAMEGEMLTDDDYRSLLSQPSIPDVVEYLISKTSYREAFRGIDVGSLHRGDLETILKRYAVDLLVKLGHYFQDRYRKFHRILLMGYEVEDLKVLIRAVYTERDYINNRHPLIYIGRYGSIDFHSLAASRSFSELVERLRGTEYYPYLVPLANRNQREDQFQIEMALDLSYLSIYKKHLKLLNRDEQTEICRIQGMRADLLNLQWIYRGKKFYNLPPEVLLNYTIGFDGHLNYRTIKDLCYSGTVEELERKMGSSRYSFLFRHNSTKDIYMERRIYRYQYHRLRHMKQMGGMDILQTIIYFQLLDYEIRDIISIVENIRYGIEDPEQAKKSLIRSL